MTLKNKWPPLLTAMKKLKQFYKMPLEPDQQIQGNITLLQRQWPKLERYQDYKPAENEEFDYNRRAEELIDTAETFEIKLQGYLDEMLTTTPIDHFPVTS